MVRLHVTIYKRYCIGVGTEFGLVGHYNNIICNGVGSTFVLRGRTIYHGFFVSVYIGK